jgi:voltage-gated potassium channel Kch
MFKYVRAMLGFPSDPYDNFLRMVYLSAVTLTTLGYGDIVPLTSWSRGITALEAVLGILIVGMFLNSVAGNFVKRWTTPSG